MEKSYTRETLKEKLDHLTKFKQLLLLTSICERMYPNFIIFSEETNYPGGDTLRASLDRVWDLLELNCTEYNLDELSKKCEDVAPDTEEYTSLYVSSALDASVTCQHFSGQYLICCKVTILLIF